MDKFHENSEFMVPHFTWPGIFWKYNKFCLNTGFFSTTTQHVWAGIFSDNLVIGNSREIFGYLIILDYLTPTNFPDTIDYLDNMHDFCYILHMFGV